MTLVLELLAAEAPLLPDGWLGGGGGTWDIKNLLLFVGWRRGRLSRLAAKTL
jgi:hypothetical protein